MEELKNDLSGILDKKNAEESKMVEDGREGEIEHSILQEEIEDAKACLKAIQEDDEQALHSIHGGTTSGSIYDALTKHFSKVAV